MKNKCIFFTSLLLLLWSSNLFANEVLVDSTANKNAYMLLRISEFVLGEIPQKGNNYKNTLNVVDTISVYYNESDYAKKWNQIKSYDGGTIKGYVVLMDSLKTWSLNNDSAFEKVNEYLGLIKDKSGNALENNHIQEFINSLKKEFPLQNSVSGRRNEANSAQSAVAVQVNKPDKPTNQKKQGLFGTEILPFYLLIAAVVLFAILIYALFQQWFLKKRVNDLVHSLQKIEKSIDKSDVHQSENKIKKLEDQIDKLISESEKIKKELSTLKRSQFERVETVTIKVPENINKPTPTQEPLNKPIYCSAPLSDGVFEALDNPNDACYKIYSSGSRFEFEPIVSQSMVLIESFESVLKPACTVISGNPNMAKEIQVAKRGTFRSVGSSRWVIETKAEIRLL